MQRPLQKLIRFARQSPREKLGSVRNRLEYWCWIAAAGKFGAAGRLCADSLAVWIASNGSKLPHLGNDRTAYVIGLSGSGRLYLNELIRQNIGKRAEYFFEDEDPFPSGSDIHDLQRSCHNQACFSRSGVAGGNEPDIGSGRIGICRFDFCISSSPRFLAIKLDFLAVTSSRQKNGLRHIERFIRIQTIYVPIWSRIF